MRTWELYTSESFLNYIYIQTMLLCITFNNIDGILFFERNIYFFLGPTIKYVHSEREGVLLQKLMDAYRGRKSLQLDNLAYRMDNIQKAR